MAAGTEAPRIPFYLVEAGGAAQYRLQSVRSDDPPAAHNVISHAHAAGCKSANRRTPEHRHACLTSMLGEQSMECRPAHTNARLLKEMRLGDGLAIQESDTAERYAR